MKKFVYIMGYGRSGSTLLEKILCNHKSFLGTGEFGNLKKRLNVNYKYNINYLFCGCGKPAIKCHVWRPVILNLEKVLSSNKYPVNYESLLSCKINKLIKKLSSDITKSELISLIIEPPIDFLVDSSKTSWDFVFRPYYLNKYVTIIPIHIIRDVRATHFSKLKAFERNCGYRKSAISRYLFSIKTALSWNFSNMAAIAYKLLLFRNKNLTIVYESMATNIEAHLLKISQITGVDNKSFFYFDQYTCNNCHQIFGNRHSSEAHLEKVDIYLDRSWRGNVDNFEQVLLLVFSLPSSLYYFYIYCFNSLK